MENNGPSPDAFDLAYEQYIAKDPEEVALYQEERRKAGIGQEIYDLRTQCGLSEEQLGQMVGVESEVIRKLEVADYEGPCEELLERVRAVLRNATVPPEPESNTRGASGADLSPFQG